MYCSIFNRLTQLKRMFQQIFLNLYDTRRGVDLVYFVSRLFI